MISKSILAVVLALGAMLSANASSLKYTKQPGVAGQITSVGSDTLANLMTYWSQEYQRHYPHVQFQIQASGSSTAPPALAEGTANIGAMSRELKPAEAQYFVRKHGYSPTMVKVAIDAIALFVNQQNTLKGITFRQIDAIFSATRYCGGVSSINDWQQVVMQRASGMGSIRRYGRTSISGTYGLFKRKALCGGDFKAEVKELPSSAAIVQSVAYAKNAIGYATYGYKGAGVKTLAVGQSQSALVNLNNRTIASGQYPLTRYLYFMVNKVPGKALPKQVFEFIRFVLSEKGQLLVQGDGYVAIPDTLVQQQLKTLSEF